MLLFVPLGKVLKLLALLRGDSESRVFQDEGYSSMGNVVLYFVVKRVSLEN